MRKHGWIVFMLAVIVVLMVFYTIAYTTDFRQIAVVKTFGKAEDAVYGKTDAGLHWKLPYPIQRLVRYDSRMFIFEDTYTQLQTKDNQNVLITLFCVWRIKDANWFVRSIQGDAKVKDCEDKIRDSLRSAKGAVVTTHPLAEFINTDPDKMHIEKIEKEIFEKVRDSVLRDYGVEIVTLGIRSLGLAQGVTEKVIESMKAERNTEAADYRARGKSIADAIRQRAKTARSQILSFANAKAERIRTEGDKAAAEYYAAFEKDEEFAQYLRKLEFWKKTLSKNAVFVLDGTMLSFIDWLKYGPGRLNNATTKPAKRR